MTHQNLKNTDFISLAVIYYRDAYLNEPVNCPSDRLSCSVELLPSIPSEPQRVEVAKYTC